MSDFKKALPSIMVIVSLLSVWALVALCDSQTKQEETPASVPVLEDADL